MANADYILRAGGYGFCPMGFLASGILELDTAAVMSGYTSPIPNGIRIGMAAMIGNEIVAVTARTGNDLTIGRGCCDTVPAIHVSGAPIWFFDDSIGRDEVEYAGTETIGVKVLPKTTTSASVPITSSPANELTFNLRFTRPYPPGLVQINGDPWFTVNQSNSGAGLILSWAHRDRITQQDQLIDHTVASIGPEVGVTYTIKVYKADNTLVRTTTGLTADNWPYPWATALADFGASTGLQAGYMTLVAVRDGLDSFQGYTINFELDADQWGLGFRLGLRLGGSPP